MIETGEPTRDAVVRLWDKGLRHPHIAREVGISVPMVYYHLKRRHEPGWVARRKDAGSGDMARWSCECGSVKSYYSKACQACMVSVSKQASEDQMEARRQQLRGFARRTGFVPTNSEAREILGLSRSRAGDIIVDTFGPDPRLGGQRRTMRWAYDE